ncbi:unnamed protein product [marine sediment metagenome]|uniref:HTH cro/C1-type domain-containing protein n=1 Tax=marine sediment metagenome TaxID=412755 RepID=X0SYZ1_9ZZZZ
MNLSELRKAKGDTQVTVAKAIGVTAMSYQNWERGACNPSEENTKKLKKYFGIKEGE